MVGNSNNSLLSIFLRVSVIHEMGATGILSAWLSLSNKLHTRKVRPGTLFYMFNYLTPVEIRLSVTEGKVVVDFC